MTKRNRRNAEQEYIDDKMAGIYNILNRNNVILEDDEVDELRRSFAGAVMEEVEQATPEVTDEDVINEFINGNIDLAALTDEEFNMLLSEVPVDLVDDFIDNNEDDLDEGFIEDLVETVAQAIVDDEDGEEDDTDDEDGQEDEDGTDGEYDADTDEEDDTDDSEEDPRSFAGYQGNQGYSEREIREAYQLGLREAREAAREAAEEVIEEREMNTTRAFAMEQNVNESEELIDNLIASGQLEPRLKNPALALMISAAGIGGQARSFAADDIGDYGEDTMFDIARNLLTALPKNKAFGGKRLAPVSSSDIRAFSADDFSYVGSDRQTSAEVDKTVRAIQQEQAEQGNRISYREALNAVMAHARNNG